jgi:peptidoglycan hydrolase-like protein with peptidoglycan-binding domain
MNRLTVTLAALLLSSATSFGALAAQTGAAGKTPAVHSMAQQVKSSSMSHNRVQELQKALNNNGNSLAVDGRWGSKTQTALRSYQRQQGLKVSGRLDRATAQKLNIAYMG